MNRDFESHNRTSRERMRAIIEGMSAEELSLPTVSGWTVSSALAHITFWDFRILHLLERWQTQDVIALPYDVDSLIESTPDTMVEKIRRAGVQFKFERNEHREYHLSEIEQALQTHRAARA